MDDQGSNQRAVRAPARRQTPRPRRRLALVAVLLLVTALLAGPAQAQPGGGDAVVEPGTISGTVTDPNTEPVEGVTVVLESTRYAWEAWYTETGADGTYEVELPPGYYAVRFAPVPGDPLAPEYYDDTYGTPTPVQVTSGADITGIDAQLEVGATVSGTVTDGEGDPVSGAFVYAQPWWGDWPADWIEAQTASDGTYELVGLPTTYVRVAAYPPGNRTDLSFEWYENAYTESQAEPLLVTVGGSTSDIDFELGPPGVITGTITGPEGQPLSGVRVEAEPSTCCGEGFASTLTGSDGTYRLEPLPPGEYLVQFRPPAGSPYLREWYDNHHTWSDELDAILVGEGETVSAIDAQLDLGGSVSGRVTGLTGRGASAQVVLRSTTDPDHVLTAFASSAGTWGLASAPAGTYVVEFQANHATEWYDDVLRAGDATTVTITAGQATTGVDGRLEHIVFGEHFETNGTRVLAQCSSNDVATFTFTVDGFDTSDGVTGGTIDFGDGTTDFAFDSSDDTVDHTFTWDGGAPTGPARQVTVTLEGGSQPLVDTFTIVPGSTGCLGSAATFTDVPPTHQFFEPIECLVDLGVTEGYADGTFRPTLPITRQGVVQWLWRLEGSPEPDALPEFDDVPPSHAFADAIAWAAERDIVGGYGDGTFRPGAPVTRQAVAAWLHRYAFEPVAAPPSGFSDVPDTHLFAEAITWLADAGITEGYADGTFRPTQLISRQGLAAWICTFSAIPPGGEDFPPIP